MVHGLARYDPKPTSPRLYQDPFKSPSERSAFHRLTFGATREPHSRALHPSLLRSSKQQSLTMRSPTVSPSEAVGPSRCRSKKRATLSVHQSSNCQRAAKLTTEHPAVNFGNKVTGSAAVCQWALSDTQYDAYTLRSLSYHLSLSEKAVAEVKLKQVDYAVIMLMGSVDVLS